MTVNSYDRYAEEYHENVKDISMQSQMDIFLSLLKEDSLILDMGCGEGRDAKTFREKDHAVIGIGLSEKLLDIAKANINDQYTYFEKMDLRKMRFAKNLFGGLWACASLIHVPKKDLSDTLKKTYEIAKEGAIFYASVKKGKGEKILPDKRYNGAPKSWSFFQKDEMEKFLTDTGFKMINEHYSEKVSAADKDDLWLRFFLREII